MVKEKIGSKYILKFYYQSMDRLWRRLLIFDLVIWLAWWYAPIIPSFRPPVDELLYYLGIIVTVVMLLALLVRRRSYVRANRDHLIVGTPLFRTKISYTTVKSLRITDLKHALIGVNLSRSDKKFIRKFAGNTPVSAIILKEMPKSVFFIRLFFPKYMFLAENRGLFFYVDQIMEFNTEFDDRFNSSIMIGDMND